MVTISKQQMQQFDGSLERQFIARVIEYLQKHLPGEVASRERRALEEQVMADIQAAKGYGIHRDADLAKWCFLSLVCGPRFHETKDIQDFLNDPLMLASTKVDYLMGSLAHTLESMEKKG